MAKGKSFERDTSRELSSWLTNGKDDDAVWYTKSSGGRATRRKKLYNESRKYDHGDLGPDDSATEYFFDRFSIELKTGYASKRKKSYQLWSILDVLDSNQSTPWFYQFWTEAKIDADASKREPMLIFRRLRRLPCIAMHEDIFNQFKNCALDAPIDHITVSINNEHPVTVANMRHFFYWTKGMMNQIFISFRINRAIMHRRHG
jgi:hypothetical protein